MPPRALPGRQVEFPAADTFNEARPLGPVVDKHSAVWIARHPEQNPVRATQAAVACIEIIAPVRRGDKCHLERPGFGARPLPGKRRDVYAKTRGCRLGRAAVGPRARPWLTGQRTGQAWSPPPCWLAIRTHEVPIPVPPTSAPAPLRRPLTHVEPAGD